MVDMPKKRHTKRDIERKEMNRKHQLFERAMTERTKKDEIWRVMDVFDRFKQWDDARIPPWIPKPITNLVRYIRILKRANLAANISKATFSSLYDEDTELIDNLQFAYEHAWEESKVPRVVRRCVDRSVLQGTSIAYVYTDDNVVAGKYYGENHPKNSMYRGKICVKRFPNGNFFPDPTAYDIDTCRYIVTTELVPLAQVKNNPRFIKYTKEQGTYDKLKELKDSNLNQESSAMGDIFKRDTQIQSNLDGIEDTEMVLLCTHWEKRIDEDGTHLDVTYYLRHTNFALLVVEDFEPNEYPFAVLYDEEEENDFWGTGTCQEVLEQNKVVNKVDQVAAMLGTLHQNPQKIVSRESGINVRDLTRTGSLPGKAWVVNGKASDAVHVLQPSDIPRGLIDLKDRTIATVKDMAGLNEAYMGNSVGSLTTSTGVQDLIERATIRDHDKMSQIDDFVERISHLIVLNIVHKWEEERPISRSLQGGGQELGVYTPVKQMQNDLDTKNLQWRVKVDTYAKAPTTQANKRAQARELMQMQAQFAQQLEVPVITVEEFIKMMDFDMSREILQRMAQDRKKMEQAKQEDMAGKIMQVAIALEHMKAQGLPPEQLQAVLYQMAQEVLGQSEQTVATPSPSSLPPQAPNGNPSDTAMANMVAG